MGIGDKAKVSSMWDNALAAQTELESIYKIEIFLTRAPKTGALCGAITVFKNNSIDLAVNPVHVGTQKLKEMEEDLSKQTEVMYKDPIKFRASEGQWIPWAMDEALRLYDQLNGATIVVKAPRLKIRESRSSGAVAKGRSDIPTLFKSLKQIDQLLRGDFQWDPWTRSVRRGDINAVKGKR